MTDFKVEDGNIDGVVLTFNSFYFDTYDEMIAFVKAVDDLYREKKPMPKEAKP
jgi:hypothetical protein